MANVDPITNIIDKIPDLILSIPVIVVLFVIFMWLLYHDLKGE